MLTSHKIKTLQLIFQSVWDNVDAVNDIMSAATPSADAIENCDFLMSKILEDVSLWRVNKAELFKENAGVKIRD